MEINADKVKEATGVKISNDPEGWKVQQDEDNIGTEVTAAAGKPKLHNTLPFPKLSKTWYKRRGKLTSKTNSRKKCTATFASIEVSTAVLEAKLKTNLTQQMEKQVKCVSKIARFFFKYGPIVMAKDVCRMYKDYKEKNLGEKLKKCPKPSEMLSILSSHLSISKIEIHGNVFLLLKIEIRIWLSLLAGWRVCGSFGHSTSQYK